MLSKEEIEFNLKALSGVMLNFEDRLCDEMQERVQEVRNYIDKLESDKQKLIEKLEKRRKQNNDKYGRAIDTDEFPEMYEHSGQVEEDDYLLSIVKGVENERDKRN